MHLTALRTGKLAIENYAVHERARILEIGAYDVNGTLRQFAKPAMQYVGIDLEAGPGVDIVTVPDQPLPFADASFDLVMASSVFEHDSFFWRTFTEMARVTSPGGFIYINAPSNGTFHRYPEDHWRFYPDCGLALVRWAAIEGQPVELVESFVCEREVDVYNDFVAVFRKGPVATPMPERFVYPQVAALNVRTWQTPELIRPVEESEDTRLIVAGRSEVARLNGQVEQLGGQLREREEQESALRTEHVNALARLGSLEREIGSAEARIEQAVMERAAAEEAFAKAQSAFESEYRQSIERTAYFDAEQAAAVQEQARLEGLLSELRRWAETLEADRLHEQARVAIVEERLAAEQRTVERLNREKSELESQLAELFHRQAALKSELTQREEEISQTAASLVEARHQLHGMREEVEQAGRFAEVLTEKLSDSEAWVFKLAGERRRLEREAARLEREAEKARKSLNSGTDESWSFAPTFAEEATLAPPSGEAARQSPSEEMVQDGTALESLRKQHQSALTAFATAQEANQLLQRKIDERFCETSELARLLADAQGRLAVAERHAHWLRLTAIELARPPRRRWMLWLPAFWHLRGVRRRIMRQGLFDSSAYLERYPDVRQAGHEPILHYLLHGLDEKRAA